MTTTTQPKQNYNEKDLRDWMETAVIGDDITYFIGDHSGGFLNKQVMAGFAMEGKLFLWRQRWPENPSLWEYHARRLSAAAGRVLKMEPPLV